jgi:hypothetical protein
LYFHPWEIDPGQPRLKARWKSRLRHYPNLHRMQRRVEEVLAAGDFVPLRNTLDDKTITEVIPVEPASHLR